MIRCRDVEVRYPARGLRRGREVVALAGVDLTVAAGEAVGIAGPSGSGKSTLARVILGLERPVEGTVSIWGVDPASRARSGEPGLRTRMQAVFQDPATSLDPLLSIEQTIEEPILSDPTSDRSARRDRVAELLHMVGLPAQVARRRPGTLSGGQRQRVALARALATSPELLILDEPVTALDASVQAQIIDLITDLRQRLGLTLVLISHDLAVVRALCSRVVVLAGGLVAEDGPIETVLAAPQADVTAELVAAARDLEAPLPEG